MRLQVGQDDSRIALQRSDYHFDAALGLAIKAHHVKTLLRIVSRQDASPSAILRRIWAAEKIYVYDFTQSEFGAASIRRAVTFRSPSTSRFRTADGE
jgi:hypothetical protein